MGVTGKKGKMKKGDGGKTYSDTGTTLKDWGITDPGYTPKPSHEYWQVKGLPHKKGKKHSKYAGQGPAPA